MKLPLEEVERRILRKGAKFVREDEGQVVYDGGSYREAQDMWEYVFKYGFRVSVYTCLARNTLYILKK